MEWVRSPFCSSGACVEAGDGPDAVHMRDTKRPDEELVFDRRAWAEFIRAVKIGYFESED
jgi:hypothetical protein